MNLDDTLTLEQLSVSFSTDDGILPAVHAVSLSLPPAGITCLVGESGCGKSLTARAILHLMPEMPISAAVSCSAAVTCAPCPRKRCAPCGAAISP